MIFRKGGHLAKGEKWLLDGVPIEVVNQYRYLGFLFTTRLSIKSALDEISTKGKQKCVQLLKVMWRLRCNQIPVFTRLFDSQIQSSLLYSAEIWGHERNTEIEKVHTFGMKRFLGLDPRTPNHYIYGDLGRFPLYINACIRAIKYWLRLGTMGVDKLPKQAYLMLSHSPIPQNRNWARAIKQCLFELGFGFVWLSGGVGNTKYFLNTLKRRLKDCYLQEWHSDNTNNERYKWYSSFKADWGLEDYFSSVHIRKFRSALVRFRFGIANLKINKRFRETQDFACPFCLKKEDEKHFLLECHEYDELRKKYLEIVLDRIPNSRLCISLMRVSDERKIRSLAMYIHYAIKHREEKWKTLLDNHPTLGNVVV